MTEINSMTRALVGVTFAAVLTSGCGEPTLSPPGTAPPAEAMAPVNPARDFGITANNVFFYYDDVERATRFYTETLGVNLVADYGGAKILRIAATSYLILVDASGGMHTADEPKSVALALVTDQLDEWYEYLVAQGVELRDPFEPGDGTPHDSFVVLDPEGYYLEFARFNAHPENERLLPELERAETVYPPADQDLTTPPSLGIKATILWLYYNDLAAIQRFYEDKFGFELIADQGWTKIYQTSPAGYIGLVDGARGMHAATEQKGVTLSFLTDDLDGWFAYVRDQQVIELRSSRIGEDDRFRDFVGYDPEGYYLEFDTFLEHEANAELMEFLSQAGEFPLWDAERIEAAADRLEQELGDQEIVWETIGSYEGHSMYLVLRGKSSLAELHETESDFHISKRGKATFVIGGELVDKELLPRKQQRGTSIRGGTSYRVTPGDIIHVPPGVAHQHFIDPDEPYMYILIKIDEEPENSPKSDLIGSSSVP